jgi:predicted RND superfamily exporter protein
LALSLDGAALLTGTPQHKKSPTHIRPKQKARWTSFLPLLICLGVTALVILVFFRSVDLKPKVGENFFFSKNDPQVRADNEISRTFPEMTEIDLTVSGDISSAAYAERIRALSDDLSKVPGVTGVVSLNPGKKTTGQRTSTKH